jgi:hypothetical protein
MRARVSSSRAPGIADSKQVVIGTEVGVRRTKKETEYERPAATSGVAAEDPEQECVCVRACARARERERERERAPVKRVAAETPRQRHPVRVHPGEAVDLCVCVGAPRGVCACVCACVYVCVIARV